jgi:hypothetical protein
VKPWAIFRFCSRIGSSETPLIVVATGRDIEYRSSSAAVNTPFVTGSPWPLIGFMAKAAIKAHRRLKILDRHPVLVSLPEIVKRVKNSLQKPSEGLTSTVSVVTEELIEE